MTSALPPLVQACSGALGSATANAVSYPLDLVATKLQISTRRSVRGFEGALRLLKYILRTEGLSGLYDGLGADTASTIVSKYVLSRILCPSSSHDIYASQLSLFLFLHPYPRTCR